MTNQKIPEIDVIIATTLWLNSNGCTLKRISVPKGEGINKNADEQRLKKRLSAEGISVEHLIFTSNGPDIEANFSEGFWKIECKGLGIGKVGTLRNNFDRALASVVSYYDSKTEVRLGLAMPKNDIYLNLIGNKIPQALRETLDLWIFLYDISTDSIDVILPTSSISTKRKASAKDAEWV